MDAEAALRKHYDGYYEGVSEWRRLGALGKADNIARLCRGRDIRRVVEIGCGEGAVLARLADLGFAREFDAFDISGTGIEAVRGRHLPQVRRAEVFDGVQVPAPDREYDLAILSHVVEHADHPRQLIREAARVARSVLVEVPLEDTLLHPAEYTPSAVGHINFYSRANFRRLVQTCGLRIAAERIAQPPLACARWRRPRLGAAEYAIKALLLALSPRLATRLTCYHMAVLCEPAPA